MVCRIFESNDLMASLGLIVLFLRMVLWLKFQPPPRPIMIFRVAMALIFLVARVKSCESEEVSYRGVTVW